MRISDLVRALSVTTSLFASGYAFAQRPIVYSACVSGDWEIMSVTLDHEPVNLSQHAGFDGFPCWTPDNHVLYVSSNPNRDLWMMDSDGSHQWLVHALPEGRPMHPSCSPDGRYIALSVQQGHAINVYVLDRENSLLEQLTTDGTSNTPSWGPDNTLYFSRTVKDAQEIFRMRLGQEPESPGIQGSRPVLSEDGSCLFFNRYVGGDAQVFLLDLRTMQETQLTHLQGINAAPVVSPDRAHVAFMRYSGEGSGIYSMNASGEEIEQLTLGGMEPDW
ncbi:hypothetical protein J4464_04600 [Candidatus Woesearchaeota archaeon]|nr:hypothetical protein [Candidatus Woesearchaeota archaeon]